jgi:hypothetical protein
METDDDGELWLREKLSVGTESTSRVEIGYLSDTDKNGKHEVIHAGDSSAPTD